MYSPLLHPHHFKVLLLLTLMSFMPKIVFNQAPTNIPKKAYTTSKISANDVPSINGKLEEAVWQSGNWASDFIQREPVENAAPTEQTAFKILYDDKYLYIGIKNYDSAPDQISNRMSRRDGFAGDWVSIIFDSYHDLRSAFSLTVTSSGIKGDKAISLNGANEDLTWNPIWQAKSHIEKEGWTVEIKIPLSQLRFAKTDQQVWGLQVMRKFFRKEEISVWQRIPIDASGWVSEFGKLHGLNQIKPQRQFELQPFVAGAINTFEKEPLNPYKSAYTKSINAGLDGKLGITNDLTLDFTINPDFGQVEADPAAIALDGFQLFFEEQRPFFVENKSIFNYRFSAPNMGGSFSSDNLFYSRRIGRSPQGGAQVVEGEYVKAPERTSILGAVKFSGKTKKGWSIGIMESVTAKEYARVTDGSNTREVLVEPLTNYFVGRIQKDFNNKNTFIGGILTATNRDLEESVAFLHRSALTGGIDVFHQWKERSWYAGANLVWSQVAGSKDAIFNTQTSIGHLFQRVGAPHVGLNPNRTVLSGHGGDLRIGKAGNGHVKIEAGLTWRSPELELNDIGFMREADDIQNYVNITYRSLQPSGPFRKTSVNYRHWLVWDFAGNQNYFDWDVDCNATFNNNWTSTFGLYSQPHIYSKSLLQGGPRVFLPDQYGAWWVLGTDQRKQLFFNYNGWIKMGNEDSHFLFESRITATYQPLDKFSLSITPQYTTIRHRLQYNQQVSYQDQTRYITSRLDQHTWSMAVRLNYTINPNISIQYYGQPFISNGQYDDFNYVIQPLAKTQAAQLSFYDAQQIEHDLAQKQFLIDENKDGAEDYRFHNPNFSFAQFRSNLVLRYEYQPGSEIFFVWSQDARDYTTGGLGSSRRFQEQLFNQEARNTFLIKLTYRFI